jgi:hypothetical protein
MQTEGKFKCGAFISFMYETFEEVNWHKFKIFYTRLAHHNELCECS